ncbi:MAG: hypothetical protein DRQ60_01375 [Gammaproteobacteria bacterium]|nr:MAG: hypothetical protein DRQ60_01375 [Gammaproteobacteria bacterium]
MNRPDKTASYAFSPQHDMKFATDVPEMGNGPIPHESITSEAYFEQEREKIFKRTWLQVGRVEEIPESGDYFTRELPTFDQNIVVVRGKDGVVRAFHNVCTHRGMALVTKSCASTRTFTCEFHGWSFGLDGQLQHVPAKESFPNLEKDKPGLNMRSLGCDTWNGFIFIHMNPEPEQPLREFLGGLADDMDGFPFDKCQHIAHYTSRVKANWKLCIDAFQEAYHAAYLHRHAIPGAENGGFALPTSVRFYEGHRSVSVWLIDNLQPTPAETIAYAHSAHGFTKVSETKMEGINPSDDERWWFDVNVFFPNFFCDLGGGWYFTYNFWPVSHNDTIWNMNIYQMEAATASEKVVQEFTRIALRDTVYEDMSTMEFSQKAFESGVLSEQYIGDTEIAVRHQYWVVDEILKKP